MLDDGERKETWVRVSVRVVGTPCCGRGDGGGRGWVRAGAYLACSSMRENTLGANMLPPPAAPSASSFPAVIFPPGPREVVCAQRSCFVELVVRLEKSEEIPKSLTEDARAVGSRHDVVETKQLSARQVLQEGPGDQG